MASDASAERPVSPASESADRGIENGSNGEPLPDDWRSPQQVVGSLTSLSFLSLLVVQTLGTLNDNLFRWLTVPIAVFILGNDYKTHILTLGLVVFTVPYLLLANFAGYLADRFPKRQVILWCKFAEIVLALLLIWGIWLGNVTFLFVIVGLIGAQSALFAPSKFGTLPENLSTESISAGNGLMGLFTILAAAGGLVLAGQLFEWTKPDGRHALWISASVVLGVAVVGWLVSFNIRTAGAGRTDLPVPWNPFRDTWLQLKLLAGHRGLMRAALGSAFFWTLASLAQMNVVVFTTELGFGDSAVGILMAVLVLGVGFGSVLAGLWSGGRVELGLVPLGSVGIVVAAIGLFLTGLLAGGDTAAVSGVEFQWRTSTIAACCGLFLLGGSAGLFNVPLDSYLQDRSPEATRGSILAASYCLVNLGMLGSAGLFQVLREQCGFSARSIFLLVGIGTIPVMVYVFWLLPTAMIRLGFWFALKTFYRVRVYGLENIPKTGGVLLVPNHVSWIDGFLLYTHLPRHVRYVAFADNIAKGVGKYLADAFGAIRIDPAKGPKGLIQSLQTSKKALQDGDMVCIFAEGGLTRTGQLQPFQRGLTKIVDGTGCPVIPVYLDGLWGSIFSFRDGKFIKKWPRVIPYPVQILYGKPIMDVKDHIQVQRAVEDLGVQAAQLRKKRDLIPIRRFVRVCRQLLRKPKLADSSGQALTGGQTLMRTIILARFLANRILARDEQIVGVLLPPAVGSCLVNAALPLIKRIAVNLNYTASASILNASIAQAGIKHVITSRKFQEKIKLELNAKYLYVEDFKDQLGLVDKLVAGILAYCLPSALIDTWFGLRSIQPDDLMTIIFTSGSTGEPKGVMLSHHNISSNLEAVDSLFQLKATDVFLGILPFFHSTGYTATLWTVLTLPPKGVYHFNPLDARQVGTLCQEHKVTIVITTPTFLRTYYKRCEKEQLATLDLVIVGAEKMPLELAQAFFEKFGIRPIEGYGTTELSPLAAVNVPDHRSEITFQKGTKEGSVGRPIPNTMAKIIDPETGAVLGLDQPGLLCLKGPNVMLGYYKKPDLTAKAIQDGWYSTGDIAKLDAEGFITITDRQSRFSKIGGEMVPHLLVEQALTKILATGGEEDQELRAVVTSVPCDKKGERLVVIHKPLTRPVDEVYGALCGCELPNLWIPSRDSFVEVESIPVLGTGKVDLRGVRQVALQKFSPPA